MSRPLVITTRTHPDAVGVYVMQALLGVVLLFHPGHATTALASVMESHLWAQAWMVLITGFALSALGAIFYRVKDDGDLRAALTVEAIACTSLTLLTVSYVIALVAVYGDRMVVTTCFVGLFTAVDALRAVQALREAARVTRAVRSGVVSDLNSLAEPEADHHTTGE